MRSADGSAGFGVLVGLGLLVATGMLRAFADCAYVLGPVVNLCTMSDVKCVYVCLCEHPRTCLYMCIGTGRHTDLRMQHM